MVLFQNIKGLCKQSTKEAMKKKTVKLDYRKVIIYSTIKLHKQNPKTKNRQEAFAFDMGKG